MNRKTRRAARIILALLFIGTGGGAVGSLFGVIRSAATQSQVADQLVTPALLTPFAPRTPIIRFDTTPDTSDGTAGDSSSGVALPAAGQAVAAPGEGQLRMGTAGVFAISTAQPPAAQVTGPPPGA